MNQKHRQPEAKSFTMHFAKPIKDTFGFYSSSFICSHSLQCGTLALDIVAFDAYLTRREGYDIDRDGSLADYVGKRWGPKAVELVEHLITGVPWRRFSPETGKPVKTVKRVSPRKKER